MSGVGNITSLEGTFSNSATQNSNLLANIFVCNEGVAIFLYTYGRSLVQNSSTRNVVEYDVTIRTDDDNRHSFTGTMYTSGDRIFIDERFTDAVIDLLSGDGYIHFHIVNSNRPVETYLFAVPTSNFAEVYELFIG